MPGLVTESLRKPDRAVAASSAKRGTIEEGGRPGRTPSPALPRYAGEGAPALSSRTATGRLRGSAPRCTAGLLREGAEVWPGRQPTLFHTSLSFSPKRGVGIEPGVFNPR